MGSVWKRLQRVNKRAAKFQFTASYHELRLETTAKWRPSNLSVVWTRRSRRVVSSPLPWEPDMMNPLVGSILWPVPDNHTISVTLFKDPRTHELEDKDWTFVIEDISLLGKKRVLANASINMRKYASVESTQQSFTLNLKPISRKITAADLELTISCVFLREGKATDEDMQSVVSFMSVNNNFDVAPLDDLEDIPDLENSGDISDNLYDFTQQLEQMTTSLNGCTDIPTPMSVPSLSEDPTPLAGSIDFLHFDLPADRGKGKIEVEFNSQLIVETDDELNIPNTVNIKSFTCKTPTKAIDDEIIKDDEQKGTEVRKSNQCDAFHEVFSSTPLDEVPMTTNIVQNRNSNRALTFDKQECNADAIEKLYEIRNSNHSSAILDETILTGIPRVIDKQTEIKEASVKSSNTKRSELPPLDLKISHEIPTSTKNGAVMHKVDLKPVERIVLKENTPGQDLLEWCKDVTKDYPNVKVTNLTTSWRNGMAFCAIIHHFMPDLIDMTKLSAHDVVGNCRIAFDAAETLGIPRVIEPRDMNLLTVPDKLAVMTYLHQLRAHFTGKQLHIEQIGPTSDESSYVIGNYKSDNLSQNLINFSHVKTHLLNQNSFEDDNIYQQQKTSPNKKDIKNRVVVNSKSIFGKVLSPTKDKNSINASYTNQQNKTSLDCQTPPLVDNGDDVCEELQKLNKESTSSITLDVNATNRILTRHKEMSEKAKLMMEKLKISKIDDRADANDNERQLRLREQARRLILETRNKTGGVINNGVDSPATPTKLKRFNYTPERTISPINNSSNGENNSTVSKNKMTFTRDKMDHYDNEKSPSHKLPDGNSSPLQSFNAVMEKISPKHEKKNDKLTYIESELEALEREQEAIDQKASNLEAKLRAVMGGNPKTEETEEQLLSQWFTLVNKKNALLRRQMQLNILEQEKDLERKFTMLNEELRAAQSVEDWRKTEVQREKERLLLEELVTIVDKRDQLVQHLHNQEIAIEDDHEIARELEQVDISGGKDKCIIQ